MNELAVRVTVLVEHDGRYTDPGAQQRLAELVALLVEAAVRRVGGVLETVVSDVTVLPLELEAMLA